MKAELRIFNKEAYSSTDGNKLAWIRNKESMLSTVAKICWFFFGIPATDNERVLSITGKISRAIRNHISTTSISNVIKIAKIYLVSDQMIERIKAFAEINDFFCQQKDFESSNTVAEAEKNWNVLIRRRTPYRIFPGTSDCTLNLIHIFQFLALL